VKTMLIRLDNSFYQLNHAVMGMLMILVIQKVVVMEIQYIILQRRTAVQALYMNSFLVINAVEAIIQTLNVLVIQRQQNNLTSFSVHLHIAQTFRL